MQGRPAIVARDLVAINFKSMIAGDYIMAIYRFVGVFASA